MSVSAGSVEIDISVNDQTSQAISSISGSFQGVRQDINENNTLLQANQDSWLQQSKAVNLAYREQRFIRREFMLGHQTFYETTRLMSGIGHAGMRLNSIFLSYNAIQIRQAQADERVADAKDRVAAAMAQYGAGSKEATDAQKELNKAMEAQQQLAMQLPGMYLGLGMSALGFAGDIGKTALDLRMLQATVARKGGIANMIKGFIGTSAVSTSAGELGGLPIFGRNTSASLGSSSGILGRLGGMRGLAGLGIGIGGTALALGLTAGSEDPTTKAVGLLGGIGSGALGGFMMGGPIGAAIGGGLSLIAGLATNYHEEFANLFAGRGFLSNKDAHIDVNVNVSADEGLKAEADMSQYHVIAGAVG